MKLRSLGPLNPKLNTAQRIYSHIIIDQSAAIIFVRGDELGKEGIPRKGIWSEVQWLFWIPAVLACGTAFRACLIELNPLELAIPACSQSGDMSPHSKGHGRYQFVETPFTSLGCNSSNFGAAVTGILGVAVDLIRSATGTKKGTMA